MERLIEKIFILFDWWINLFYYPCIFLHPPNQWLNLAGCFLWWSVLSWKAFAACKIEASSYKFPINVMLSGRPLWLKPMGIQTTGLPVRLVIDNWLPAKVGVMTTSYFFITSCTFDDIFCCTSSTTKLGHCRSTCNKEDYDYYNSIHFLYLTVLN